MTNFTYEIPNEGKFLEAVLLSLKRKGCNDIVSLLKGSKCTITHAGQFSYKVWDHYWTTVNFEVPMSRYEEVVKRATPEIRETIRSVCDEVMPARSGLDVMEVNFAISLEDVPENEDLTTDLERTTKELPAELRSEIIPEDLKEKAQQMSKAYIYLYCVENALRAFIEKIGKEKYGDDYLKNMKLNADMTRKIDYRKKSKEKIKWLSARGDSDIFYLDLEDLGTIIRNNWDVFDPYFPSQEWIVTNVNEIAECRHPVAHNSYLEEHERDVIRIDFAKIIRQIGKAFE